jgi:hypothetical protein
MKQWGYRSLRYAVIMCLLVSILFVNPTFPPVENARAEVQIMEENMEVGGIGISLGADYTLAQSFIARGNYKLLKVTLVVMDRVPIDDFIEVEIWSNNPGLDVPLGAISTTVDNNTKDNEYEIVEFNFETDFLDILDGEMYWIVARSSLGNGQQGYLWIDSQYDAYGGGFMAYNDSGSGWVQEHLNDLVFQVHGEADNDFGVKDIIAPKSQDLNIDTQIISTIRNYGKSGPSMSVDVNCIIEDPLGMVIYNFNQWTKSLSEGEEDDLFWNFVPILEGIYRVIIIIPSIDDNFGNNEMEFFIEVKAPAILKLHEKIRIDGLRDDWFGDPPPSENTGTTSRREFIWNDARDDDVGDGDYVYPTDPSFEEGCFDLLEFRVAVDSESINFLLEFDSIETPDDPPRGFVDQFIEILIDTDRDGTGRTDTLRDARLKLDHSNAWEYAIWFDGFFEGGIEDEEGAFISDELSVVGNPDENIIEFSIPAKDLPPFDIIPDFERWGYVVLVGGHDNEAIFPDERGVRSGFLEVNTIPSDFTGGGGLDHYGADSNIYDIAFAAPQEYHLNNYEYLEEHLVSYTMETGYIPCDIYHPIKYAQSFSVSEVSLLTHVELFTKNMGSEKNQLVGIMSNAERTFSDPWDDIPSDNFISSIENLVLSDSFEWNKVALTIPVVVRPDERYWVVAFDPYGFPDGSQWGMKQGDPFPEGYTAYYDGSIWHPRTNDDMLFKTYSTKMTEMHAQQTVHFAPLVINEVSSSGDQDDEWISLYFNGTKEAPPLDMEFWTLTDQDGIDYVVPKFLLDNYRNVTIHTGFGSDTTTDLYMNEPMEAWDDLGDDVLIKTDLDLPVDYMNYTDGVILGDPPPLGITWEPEAGEELPQNPQGQQKLILRYYGRDNDLYIDWKIKTSEDYQIKTLYFFDDRTYDPDDPEDFMNTRPPENTIVENFDADSDPGLTILKSGSGPQGYHEFNLTPVLARDFSIVDEIEAELWVDDDGYNASETVILTLYDCDGLLKAEVAQTQTTFQTDDISAKDGTGGWQKINILFPYINYVVPKGNYLSFHIMMVDGKSSNDLWLAYNATGQPSCLRTIPTKTYVNVEWAKTFDLGEAEMSDFNQGEDVLIKANVTDPFGSYDISGADITIKKPSEPGFPPDDAMSLDEIDPSNPSVWKIFSFTYTDTTEPGLYNVRITGIESNGVVHQINITFNVLVNNPPELFENPLVPSSGYENETFNFTVNYKDIDNDPPDEILVNITDHGTYTLMELDSLDQDYSDGKDYYLKLGGFKFGNAYSYHFAASDSKGFWVETIEIDEPVIINCPPSLSNPDIDNNTGNASTTFTFTVTFTDLENEPPDSISVNISGPSHSGEWTMQPVDPGDENYTDGKDYEYTYQGFINGFYSFHFAASDSEGAWDETPEDPRPLVVNSLPILLDPEVSPQTGYIDTDFKFTVTYYDLDDHPPSEIYVNISGPSHSGPWLMTEVDSGDSDYTDGKEYEWSDSNFIMGAYQFHCAASDTQGAWRETTVLFKPTVFNSRPVLSGHNLDPSVGDPGVTVFNYTVTYSDLDNHAPGEINVTIFGPSGGNYSLIELDPSDTDYTDGKEYYYTTTLAPAGTYSYRIDAKDNNSLWAIGIIDSGPSVGQEKPVLSQPDVSPHEGIRTTMYYFTINFTDQQNDPAGTIKLNLSGPYSGNFTMSEVDPGDDTTSDGKFFFFETNLLTKGTYSFIVWGEDDKGNPAVSTRKFKPNVRNSIPQLSGGFTNESEFGGSWFNFTVTYTDIDNDSPSAMKVNITGFGIENMVEVDPGDTDYTDGKDYYYYTTFTKGSYSYHFAARDSGLGVKWKETPEEGFTLKNNLPIFDTISILPVIAYGEDNINFTVTIFDHDGDDVSLMIFLQGEPGSPYVMSEVDVGDLDTKDGKEFYYSQIFSKGNYNYNFSVYDTEQFNQTTVQILNVRNNAPVIPTADILTATEDSYYSNDYNYTDLDGDLVTWSLDTNATWLNLDLLTREIYGTPTNLHVGSFYVNISCDDGDGGIGYHYFTLTVTNTLPTITTSPNIFAEEDFIHIDDFNCVDDGQGTITYSFLSNATWLGIDSGSGILSGTANNLDVGWYWVEVRVDDGNGGIFPVNYTLTVNNTPPTILTTPLQIALEDFLIIDDFNCDDDSQGNITYTMASNGTWFNPINPISGTLSGTPGNSDVGWCWVTITVTDGNGGSDSKNYTITVLNVNDAPVIQTLDVLWAFEDSLYYVDYDAIDIDPTKDILTWYFQTNASWLAMNISSGEVYGTPTNGDIGSYWVNISVSDGKGGSDVTNFTLTVDDENDPPVITTTNLEFCPEDSYYEVDYDFIDIDDPAVTWILNTNASWLSIDPVTGVLNGTPDNGDVGWCWVNITADDGRTGTDSVEFNITINNTAPVMTSSPDEYANEDLVHIDNFDSNDDGQGNVYFSYETNATWFGFDPITGVLIGTANNTHVGSYWVEVTVHDGNGGTDSVNYTLTVINAPPSILTVPLQTVWEDSFFFDDYNCDDDGQGTIIYSLTSNATWLSINTTTGALSGTPDNSHVGWFWVNVSVADGNGGLDFRQYDVTVFNVNDDPQITTSNIEFASEDILYSVDYDAIDIDPTKDTLTWNMQTNASWLNFNSTTGELWGTPLNGDIGIYWVNVSVSDGIGGMTWTDFNITVSEENDPPDIITPNNEFAVEDSYYEVDYNFTDLDDPIVSWELSTNALWLSINPVTGLLYGTPDNTEVGSYWVNVRVEDNRGGSDFTNFTLTVNNTPPSITNIQDEFVDEDQYHQDDFDCDDDGQGSITYSLSTNATWLSFDPFTGILNGTPENTEVGWYWINITVYDGNGGSDFRNYTFFVNNSQPTINTTPLLNAYEDSQYVMDFNSIDDGKGNIVYSLGSDAPWLSIDPATGIITGIPENDDVGSYWVNVTVMDGNLGAYSTNYTLTVLNTNDPPEIAHGYLEFVDEDSFYFFDFEYSDIDGDIVTWTIESNGTWLHIDQNTGGLSGIPRNSDVGSFYVNVIVDDGNGGLDNYNFTVFVNNTNDPPSIPQMLLPSDDSTVNTTTPTFSWNPSIDADYGDSVAYYIIQYSTSSDFLSDVTEVPYIASTIFTPIVPLSDKTVYYWRVQAVDIFDVESGFQSLHFVFLVDTGYFAPIYIGGLKSVALQRDGTWQIDLDDYFRVGSETEGLIYSCNYNEVKIDPETHIATWTPKSEDDALTDVTFTLTDGATEVESFPIDITVTSELTVWDRIFWPYSLIPLILFGLLGAAIMTRKWKNRPFVEEVFFISENGRLISHATVKTDEEVDEDILSGMLTGVKDLITDAFVRDESKRDTKGLHKLEFGDSNIMLEKGDHFFIAIVFKGIENRKMLKKIKNVITVIQNRYGNVLASWDGDMDSFEGADRIIATLLSTEALTKEEKDKIEETDLEKEEKIIEKWSAQMMESVDDEGYIGYGEEYEGQSMTQGEKTNNKVQVKRHKKKDESSEESEESSEPSWGRLNRIK